MPKCHAGFGGIASSTFLPVQINVSLYQLKENSCGHFIYPVDFDAFYSYKLKHCEILGLRLSLIFYLNPKSEVKENSKYYIQTKRY